MTAHLLGLPREVLHSIFGNVDPQDIGRLPCCRDLRDFIRHDRLLFKELFMIRLDLHPWKRNENIEVNWERELQRFVKLRLILATDNLELKVLHDRPSLYTHLLNVSQRSHMGFVTQSVSHIVEEASYRDGASRNIAFLAQHFHENSQNADIFLCGSSLFKWASSDAWSHHPLCKRYRHETVADEDVSDDEASLAEISIDETVEIMEQDDEIEPEKSSYMMEDGMGSPDPSPVETHEPIAEENTQDAKPRFWNSIIAQNEDSGINIVPEPVTDDAGPSNENIDRSTVYVPRPPHGPPPNTVFQPHHITVSTSHAIDEQQNREALVSSPPVSSTTAQKRMQQLCAKLHSLHGVPIEQVRRGNSNTTRYALRGDTAPIHPYARSKVYDLRQHTEHNFWGPFLDDGSQNVDWEKIEAIMIILNHSMKLFTNTHDIPAVTSLLPQWNKPFEGATPHSYVSRPPHVPLQPMSLPPTMPPSPDPSLESQDPYNITGTWMRVICFLDYTELYDFNFAGHHPPSTQPRPALDTEEAIRIITMKLRITAIYPSEHSDGLPVVHFKGGSSSFRPSFDPNANSEIKGIVQSTPEGEIRWTTWSLIHGEERWRSEGIQVGGIQSARGVIGYWFDKDFDEHGPAGPTAFWKSYDGIEEMEGGSVRVHDLYALHVPL